MDLTTAEEPTLQCPDCQGVMSLARGSRDVFWCKPCKRARVPEHLEPYEPMTKTIEAKFKRVSEQSS